MISLFGFDPAAPPAGRWANVEGIAHFLSVAVADHLHRLANLYEVVWCTGWEEKAPHYLPGLLGLQAEFPHLSFDRNPGSGNAHWKLAAIDAHAGPDRAVGWIDDAHDERTQAWARARPGPTLLVSTEPASGLREEHVEQLLDWARSAELSS